MSTTEKPPEPDKGAPANERRAPAPGLGLQPRPAPEDGGLLGECKKHPYMVSAALLLIGAGLLVLRSALSGPSPFPLDTVVVDDEPIWCIAMGAFAAGLLCLGVFGEHSKQHLLATSAVLLFIGGGFVVIGGGIFLLGWWTSGPPPALPEMMVSSWIEAMWLTGAVMLAAGVLWFAFFLAALFIHDCPKRR